MQLPLAAKLGRRGTTSATPSHHQLDSRTTGSGAAQLARTLILGRRTMPRPRALDPRPCSMDSCVTGRNKKETVARLSPWRRSDRTDQSLALRVAMDIFSHQRDREPGLLLGASLLAEAGLSRSLGGVGRLGKRLGKQAILYENPVVRRLWRLQGRCRDRGQRGRRWSSAPFPLG